MSQRHLPVYPPEWRLDQNYQERLQRGGSSLPVRPRLRVARRRRTVPLWRVAEVARRILKETLLGAALGLAAAFLVIGLVGHGMGWL